MRMKGQIWGFSYKLQEEHNSHPQQIGTFHILPHCSAGSCGLQENGDTAGESVNPLLKCDVNSGGDSKKQPPCQVPQKIG
ncbi:hypothetical protein GDO78_015172 [Eleutherodactylus coqui]|uniref:Uncharacterized protein n=1 Tax=Eleutherodactylus coqui TaxID=57060 RepID=A0A8J6EDV3_ELECQ|nr:hypothetical protein GDO78_015172 [Eleutherodactylus coqui]